MKGMRVYPLELADDRVAYLQLPRKLTTDDAERLKGMIDALVVSGDEAELNAAIAERRAERREDAAHYRALRDRDRESATEILEVRRECAEALPRT